MFYTHFSIKGYALVSCVNEYRTPQLVIALCYRGSNDLLRVYRFLLGQCIHQYGIQAGVFHPNSDRPSFNGCGAWHQTATVICMTIALQRHNTGYSIGNMTPEVFAVLVMNHYKEMHDRVQKGNAL